MSNVIGSQVDPLSASCTSDVAHPLFDTAVKPAIEPGNMPTSVLPPELRQLSFGRADTAHAPQLLKTLAKSTLGYSPTSPPLLRHIDLYVAMSALQKAIRVGNPILAIRAAQWMIERGLAAAMWTRLRTIGVEDIGLGDPEVAAFVVWLAGNKDLRAEIGDLATAVCAINCTTQAVKSRDMTDLAYWSGLPGSIDHLMPIFGQARSADLVLIASNPGETLRTRHAAARALFPFRHPAAPIWKRRRLEDRLRLYEALAMPPTVVAMIESDVACGGDVLTSAGPMAWAMLRGSRTIKAGQDPFHEVRVEMAGDVLAASYDRYTRTGRRIISKMLKDHTPWADFFASHPAADPMECMMRAIFYVEGGVLHPRQVHDLSDRLYWDILEAKLATTGIRSMSESGSKLLAIARDALPILNQRRRSAIGQH